LGGSEMERRLGVVGVVIEDRKKAAPQVNEILSEHGEIIAGRMGLALPGEKCVGHCFDCRWDHG